ncbi:MAG: nucleoside 2-deoxyribosyltransferase [Patescibacteria group bacterium]|nr:nucleoside 2-deoxyribosyltransferase [Patescibacteria group bacterium]MDD4304154.1 nucleoside 2-deoxyribosyltransferase [Patescibacteria group bacterium]MDD4695185.1 nucleoside 2-deoxyribosyltransferase [Patescibacteria group bacterium]
MKIYFAGSITGGRDDKDIYRQMIKILSQYGTVLTEHVGNVNLNSKGEIKTDKFIYNRDMSWLKESDIIIAEISTPSIGVGYELGSSEAMEKNILCFYREQKDKRIPVMISGNKNIKIEKYKTIEDFGNIIKKFFNK